MRGEVSVVERVIADLEDGDERRRVSLIEGDGLTLMEHSSGPVTEVSYGSREHTHKMMFGREACSQALGVPESQVVEALVAMFAAEGEKPFLSDVMDRFDTAGAHYAYVAWSNKGDAAYRRGSSCGGAAL